MHKTSRMRSTDRLLYSLLALTVSLPPFAILVGIYDQRVLFTLYREPKLAAFQILGWLFLLLLVWLRRPSITKSSLSAVLRQPLIFIMSCFVAYGAATYSWTLVGHNLFYELNQYLFLLALLIALHSWGSRDPAVIRVTLYCLVFSLLPLVCVGLAQSVVDMPLLRSIDPGYGVRHASFMGYKNPMALSVLGHFFLLLYVTWDSFEKRRGPLVRLALAGCSLAELAYLVSLQSRSALFSLLASCAVLGGIFVIRSRRLRHLLGVLAASTLAGVLLWLLLVLNPAAMTRFESLAGYFEDPSSFLDTDRGTYLRNTLNMTRHNPFGVGLGDWQTHYPVYRSVNRDLAFTASHQVRRAHSDYVQLLGELGAPGVALWLALLAAAQVRPLRHYLKTGNSLSLFLTVQIFAFIVAMATDYLLETPYNKFQFFLVCGLAMTWCRPQDKDGTTENGQKNQPEPSRARPLLAAVCLAAWSTVAIANIWFYSQQTIKNYCSSMLTTWYTTAIDALNAGQPARATERLSRVERYGKRFRGLSGHSKTFYRDYLALAHASFLRGRTLQAIELTRQSLLLHPYHPNAFGLLASILGSGAPPQAVQRSESIQRYLMDQASTGFLEPYPAFLRPAAAWPEPFEARGGESGARRRTRKHWRGRLAGRTLALTHGTSGDRAIGKRFLYLCGDGRYYSEAEDEGGPRIDFGWWRIKVEDEEALAELRPVVGTRQVLLLAASETALWVDGKAAEIRANDVCE